VNRKGQPRASRLAAVSRIILGLAQMFGATFSAVLLLQTGVNAASLGATAITLILTVLSRVLFRGR
jgi:hypothetical protein